MNFLAHLVLSDNNPEIAFGNFIGDSIKGKKYKTYPENIQKGILLHRFIDSYTDNHPIIRQSKQLVNPKFRHFKGVIVDVFNDHFLSKHWAQFSKQSIPEFLSNFEKIFSTYKNHLPPSSIQFYSRFIELQFMKEYINPIGIENTLKGLENRIKFKVPLVEAMKDFELSYDVFDENFKKFFPDIFSQCQLLLKGDLKPMAKK